MTHSLRKATLATIMGGFLGLWSCGPDGSQVSSSHVAAMSPRPVRFALVADSIATSLFADSNFAQPPHSRPSEYSKLQSALGLLATFKPLLRNKTGVFRVMQIVADMNQTFGPLTNPYKSLYHRAAYNQGGGSHIEKESAIIASKVVPESFNRHIANYTQWRAQEFDALMFALGSNDICNSWQTADQFEQHYRGALRHLTETFPGKSLVVVSPPHIPFLGQPQIANAPMFGMPQLQCRDYFEIVTCPTYQDTGRFYDFIRRMRRVAAEFTQATFIDLSEDPIRLDDLSGDCFHPSFKGHERFTHKLQSILQSTRL